MKVKYFFAGVMALGLLASCVKEDTNDGGKGPGEGALEAEATVTIKLYGQGGAHPAAANTRAEGDDEGKDEGVAGVGAENELQSVDVLVFSKTSKEQDNDEAKFESVTSFKTPITGNTKQKVLGTEGWKIFVAIANDKSKLIDWKSPDNQNITFKDFKDKLFEAASESKVAGAAAPSIGIININKTDAGTPESFLMVSNIVAQEIVSTVTNAAATNEILLTLERLTAKVQMKWKGEIGEKFEPTIDPAIYPDAKFADGTFMVMNIQTKMYPLAPVIKELKPNDKGDGYGSVLGWLETKDETYKENDWVASVTDFTGEITASGYATENLMFEAIPKKKHATCLLVKTAFIAEGETPATFWAIGKFKTEIKTEEDMVYKNLESFLSIHKTKEDADKAFKDLDDPTNCGIVEFKDGTTYYRVDLLNWVKGDGKSLQEIASTQRNRFYQVSVNNILSLGWPKPEEVIDPDDNDPVDDPMNIEATIQIAPWVKVEQDTDLQ